MTTTEHVADLDPAGGAGKVTEMTCNDGAFVLEGGVEKSVSDSRSYRMLTLENKLQVLCIYDANTEKVCLGGGP